MQPGTVQAPPVQRLSKLEQWDRSLSLAAYNKLGTRLPRSFLLLFEHGGNGLFWIPGAVAAWALPSLSPAMRMCVANLLLGFVLDLILVGTIKGLVRRGRPVYNKEGDFVLVVSVDKFSFPSGHSSRAVFIAGFACVCWGWGNRPLCVAIAAWGLTTAASRALMGRHYVSDVIAGIALGLVTTALVTQGTYRISEALISEPTSERWYRLAEAAMRNPAKQWHVFAQSAQDTLRNVVDHVLYAAFPEV